MSEWPEALVEKMRVALNEADADYSAREQRADAGGGEMEPGDWFTFLATAALDALGLREEECDGSDRCRAWIHVHGCYTPHRSDACDAPNEFGHLEEDV